MEKFASEIAGFKCNVSSSSSNAQARCTRGAEYDGKSSSVRLLEQGVVNNLRVPTALGARTPRVNGPEERSDSVNTTIVYFPTYKTLALNWNEFVPLATVVVTSK